MARVNISEVQKISGTTQTDIQIHLDQAHIMVEQYLSGQGLGEDLLKIIEGQLAAHFTALNANDDEVRAESKQAGDLSISFARGGGNGSFGLGATRFGQMAKALDSSGKLKAADKKPGQLNIGKHTLED